MEPASLTTWVQPVQLRSQSIQSVWKYQVLFRILQTFKNLNLLFIGQMIESRSEKCLAQNESFNSVGVHVGSSLTKVKDTHFVNNNQPVAEILCWRLVSRFGQFIAWQDCFLQKEARVYVSNAFVIEDSKFKWCFLLWNMSKWQRKQIC